MSVFDNFTKKVTETAKAAAKKSGDIVEATKLNVAINTEEDKIHKELDNIGKIIYERYKNDEEVGDAKSYCELIRSYEQNIADMKQKIYELKKVKICPSCSTELDTDVAFCPKCGAKQATPQPVAEEPTEKICAACGTENEVAAAFCSKCGNKI